MNNNYSEEAKKRWGNTTAFKQSQERVKKMTKEDFALIRKEGDALMTEIIANRSAGVGSETIQTLIERHFNALRHFYDPSLELYRGLANLYVEDKRFSAHFEKYTKGLAQFMHDAMIVYCDRQKNRN